MKTVTITRTLHTTIIRAAAPYLRTEAFLAGYDLGHKGKQLPASLTSLIAAARADQGFKEVAAPLLTAPDSNIKLQKGATPTYGLTLAHANISGYEACPWRGHCTSVCVLNNGNGRYPATQRAWIWRTRLLAEATIETLTIIGWELGRATLQHGNIMWRPNVNSDLIWHRIIPNIRWAELGIQPYGYTKNPAVLNTNGWIDGFRYAYSINETTDTTLLPQHLTNGGAIAIVTNRKTSQPPNPNQLRQLYGTHTTSILNADTTDLWMIHPNVIGDLSAKGRAKQPNGLTQNVYTP
jgi:hypothetical protein